MSQGASDNCGTCEFSRITLGPGPTSKDDDRIFTCRVRHFVIENPFWTYCHNHQRRNPLMTTRPRGPVWAGIAGELRGHPLSEQVLAIPELVLPRDLSATRVPYFGDIRPLYSDHGRCEVYGEEAEHTIALRMADDQRVCFCSPAHYLLWWLERAPNAASYRQRRPVTSEVLYEDLLLIGKELARLELDGAQATDEQRIRDILGGLEGVVIQTGHGYVDLAGINEQLARVQEDDELSPHLLVCLQLMAEIGEAFQADSPDLKAIHLALRRTSQAVQDFLSGRPFRGGSARRRRRASFWKR